MLGLAGSPAWGQELPLPRLHAEAGSNELQLEAVWLLDREPAAASPLERLMGPFQAPGSERRVVTGAGRASATPQFGASLSLERGTAAMALLCRSGVALSSLGALSEHCLLAEIGSGDPFLDSLVQSRQVELGWRDPVIGLDLSFGLFWLRGDTGAFSHPLGAWSEPSRFPPQAASLSGAQLSLARRFDLGDDLRLVLGGRVARQSWQGPGLPGSFEADLIDIGLGLERGALSGALTGRQVRDEGLGLTWRALDLGVSWRTPWHGQLSVGARNLLGRSEEANPLMPRPGFASDPLLLEEPSQGRVPYVRYQQDL